MKINYGSEMEVGLGQGIEVFRSTFRVGKLSPEEEWRHG